MATFAPSIPETMKAVQWTVPGKDRKEILSFTEEALVPDIHGSQILIKVHASAINPVDWKLMKGGVPRLLMPSIKVPCLDVAGTVVGIGATAGNHSKAPKLHIGDEVMAMLDFSKSGALQEYTVVDEKLLIKKPARWTFEQAAAWPLVASTVWQGLVVRGKIKKGDKVLINGASGGTGTVAVQLAKALGAHVVGVCSTANVELVKGLGADEVVDYKTTDVTKQYKNQDFDIVFDTVDDAKEIWNNRATILKPTGNLICIVGSPSAMDSPFHLIGEGVGIASKKVTSLIQCGPGYHLYTTFPDGEVLRQAIEHLSDVDPVIDSVNEFTLPSVLAAFDKSQSSRAKGKIVFKIA
ncbi:hypothetical protein BGZ83_012165 [Gryganskiella cystojenkinii]|nr:hypothetical protein BGZ83_012165 [Gryganskiella cystojenkinii]